MDCWNPNDDDEAADFGQTFISPAERQETAWQEYVKVQVEIQLAMMERDAGPRPEEDASRAERRLLLASTRVEFCHDRARAALRTFRAAGGTMPEGLV